MVKYIFITGGVLSSLGKGLTSASIAYLLETSGIRVAMLKLDPYLNVDPGTMNPFEHGEVYVTDDGAETDLDLGHYHRYTDSPLSKLSNVTSGQLYDAIIKKERRGDYLGKTVQVIPHITDEIKHRILEASKQKKDTQLLFVEIGGTVGDIESLPFLEAIRQFRNERKNSCINIHLTYVPYLKAAGEVKTKPTQHSVQVLREIGISPDMILCRCEEPLQEELKEKIALFCSVAKDCVIDEPDVQHSIYEVPLQLHREKIDQKICELLSLRCKEPDLTPWNRMLKKLLNPKKEVTIGIVGKYLDHQDAYKSVFEALHHAGVALETKVIIKKFESDKLEDKDLRGCDGYLIPGGFGSRGWEGKIKAAEFCRKKQIPYFGICLGMQVLVIEYARHVLGLPEANSTEFDQQTPDPVVSILKNQKKLENLGGTMRLGSYPCHIREDSLAGKAYHAKKIFERHRHRYEVNNTYKKSLEDKGLLFSGIYKDGDLCEIAEIPNHPWMLGVQFHPEFLSKPLKPHPLFKAFIAAALKQKEKSNK